jgi:TonB-dependent starch-binding outer membrane protein SusC
MDKKEKKCDYHSKCQILKFHPSGLLALLIVLLSFSTVQAGVNVGSNPAKTEASQQKKVSGKVTDEKGEPLPGVTIVVKGTTAGIITDIDGKYSINMPNGIDVLTFSFIGYKINEIKVGNRSVVNAVLSEDVKNIDEVVVVGYGTQKKSHLTGSVASLKTEGLDEIPVSDVSQALQGKMAGVTVQQTDPMAGQSAEIRVRGFGSISAAVQPLVVVDGFPIPDGLSSVSMGNVESIEVLKDAASAAMYGSRASGGVILVTTKSGNSSKPKYNFKMYSGPKTALKLPTILNNDQYVQLQYDEAAMRMKDPKVDGTTATMKFNLSTDADKAAWLMTHYYIDQPTDWIKEVMRDQGSVQNYQLSATGGNKDIKYFISGNYYKDQGIAKYNNFDKFNFLAKVDINLSKMVTVGFNLSPTYSKQTVPAVGISEVSRSSSWLPVRHNAATAALTGKIQGDYAMAGDFSAVNLSGIGLDGTTWDIPSASLSGSSAQNPTSINERTHIQTDDYKMQSNAYVTINIVPGLQFKTTGGAYADYKEYNMEQKTSASKSGNPNTLSRQLTLHTEMLTENMLNYNKKIGNHEFAGVLGFTYQKTDNKYNQIVGTNFPNDDMLSFNLASALILDSPAASGTTSFYYSEALMSYIGRLTYAYKGKYLLSASLRADGSSKFAEGNKWGTFPAASLGWRASEEKFLKKYDWLSNMKLRASYGLTGNNNIPQYSYLNGLNTSNYVTGSGNGSLVPGMAASDPFIGNPNITWEQTKEGNFGIDLGLFKSRINLTVEYYTANTIQLLLQQPAMYITGHQTFWNNIGKVNNKGIEIELSTTNINYAGFTWKTTANFSTNKNTLLSYGDKTYQDNFGERSEVYRAIVGQPAIQYFGYKSDGVWKTFEEVAAAKAVTDPSGKPFVYTKFPPLAGGLKVVNTNGDNAINPDDRVVLGTPFPDFTWGMTNTFSYKGFDFSFLIQGVQGGKIIDGNMNYNETLRTVAAYVANRWVSPSFPGDGKTTFDKTTSGGDLELTDYVMQNASYIAFRDFTLGYQVPARIAKSLKLGSIRAYCTATNLFYIMGSDYKGVNPEARFTTGPYSKAFPLVAGYQRGTYPLTKAFTLGIDVNF